MLILVAIGGAVLFVLILIMFVLSRIKVAGPNEAFIVTGRKGRTTQTADGTRSTDMSGQKVVLGASVFVLPVVQKLQSLDLSSRRIDVSIKGAVSKQGIRAELHGVAIVKVGGTEDAIRAAAQRFLHQQNEIESFTREVLAGALRSIVGRLTVEEIIRDRAAFASAVAEEAEHSMTNQGLVLDTFQLQDILAEGSYLQDLGRPEAARVLKDAAIAEARARQGAETERLLAEEAIAEANRNLALKQAGIQAEIDAAKAKSAAAGPLAQAERDQAILSEQQKVAERNAELKQRQLDTEVRKPADAARYKVEQEAEAARNAAVLHADAQRQSTIAAAQAVAEQSRLTGEGERARRAALAEANAIEGAKEGEAEQRRRTAIADAVEREGQAEAAAILAKGQAEAEAMSRKAEAFATYGEAAVLDLLVKVLPKVVEAASAPVSAIDKITVISTDGASSLTKSVASNVAQGLQLGSDLTGVDLTGRLARLGAARIGDEQVVDGTLTNGGKSVEPKN
ncbi:flotillin family protein [Plantactinospora sp. S1510]|uniref:Flotillin family protein n=1 Tax=Plantactinospora alkalitolerans TaxID=2789879 RepID=A0ABS0GV63_9ACTN|nr:SPFH domain-containing protein [Plantactinospora alkalitolerans]MBF9130039.1 flotillin family protein [Plantactinospora alkalitolerans]MBF9130085.1 flotillin family protein [Plantactinospora alkalitolerans]